MNLIPAIDLNIGAKVELFQDGEEFTVLSNYPTGYGWTQLTFNATPESSMTCDAVVTVPLTRKFKATQP